LHERVAEAELVGTGGGDELFERGELSLPAEAAEAAVGEGAGAAGASGVEVAGDFAAELLSDFASVIEANGGFGEAVDEAVAEEGDRIRRFDFDGVEVFELDRAATDDAIAAGDNGKGSGE